MPVRAPYRNGSRRTEKESSNEALGPEAFPLGSPESRAAARLRLKKLETPPDYVESHLAAPPEGARPMTPWLGPWKRVTGVDEIDESKHSAAYEEGRRLARKLLGIGGNGDFRRLAYSPPAVWRILEAGEVNIYDLPCCPSCGTAYVERGRYGILVRFEDNCADRHDPAPPPKRDEYDLYWARLSREPGLTLHLDTSRRYIGVEPLIDEGFLVASSDYLDWVGEEGASYLNKYVALTD